MTNVDVPPPTPPMGVSQAPDPKSDLRCDILILVATSTEEEELKTAAKNLGLPFSQRNVVGPHGDKLKFFSLGKIGPNTVNAVRTGLGPLSHRGSASSAIRYRIATSASAIIQLGMAFGIDPERQKIGNVLVSTSIIPYDLREVRPASSAAVELPRDILVAEDDVGIENSKASHSGEKAQEPAKGTDEADYVVSYVHATRHRAKSSLIKLFEAENERTERAYGVHFGGMLSGGARIFSRKFLGELVKGVPQADDSIVGGEMEGAGLLSVSPPEDPLWIVVKGISDFADKDRDSIITTSRPVACRNSAEFVLSALVHWVPDDEKKQEQKNG